MTRLLEGAVIDVGDPKDGEIRRLEDEIGRLEKALRRAQEDADETSRQAQRAVANLRRQLSPLFQALRMVFGELDAFGGSDEALSGASPGAAGTTSARLLAIVNDWKAKNPPADGKILDALLLRGAMTVTEMSTVCKMSKKTIYPATSRMGRGGVIVNQGGRFALKQD